MQTSEFFRGRFLYGVHWDVDIPTDDDIELVFFSFDGVGLNFEGVLDEVRI